MIRPRLDADGQALAGEEVELATVEVRGGEHRSLTTTTDGDGRFAFGELMRGLYRLDRDPPTEVARAPSPDGRTPFELHDLFCSAPLAVLENALYAGSQRDGALWRIVEERR